MYQHNVYILNMLDNFTLSLLHITEFQFYFKQNIKNFTMGIHISFLAHLFSITQLLELHREDPLPRQPIAHCLRRNTFQTGSQLLFDLHSQGKLNLQSLIYLRQPKKLNINMHIIENSYIISPMDFIVQSLSKRKKKFQVVFYS